MSFFDIVLLVIIGGFGLFGLWFGLIHTLGSLIGTILGVYLAARWYAPVAAWLMHITGWNGNFSKVLVFILAFILINRLVGLAFYLLDRFFSIITRLPFIKSIDRLFGLVFGILEGLIVLGVSFFFINKFPLSAGFMAHLAVSKIAPICVGVSTVLWPFIPQALKAIKDTLNNLF